MSDLKTLKDMGRRGYIDFDENEKNGTYTQLIKVRELRQEAIKRYKYHKNNMRLHREQGDTHSEAFCRGMCNELIDFFNLTDEDLK